MKYDLYSDTIFHSQRPYLTVANYYSTHKIGTYYPNKIDNDNSNGYVVSDHTDFGLELLDYVGGGGAIDVNKPFIMLCLIYTVNNGWTWVMGNTAPADTLMIYSTVGNSQTFPAYSVNTIKSNSTIQVRVGFRSSDAEASKTGISLMNPAYKKLVPERIVLIQLEHSINNFNSTKLNGPIDISGTHGVKVGNTNFFANSYLTFKQYSPNQGDYYKITSIGDAINYLYLSHKPLSDSRVSVNFNSKSISADNKEIFGPSNMYLRKIIGHVEMYNTTTNLLSLSDFSAKDYSSFKESKYLNGIGFGDWLSIDLTNKFGFSGSNALAVFLRFKWKNAPSGATRYKIISGVYTLNSPIATDVDLPGGGRTLFEGSGLMKGNDNHIYFICNANDVYESNDIWETNGNIILRHSGSNYYTDYVTELTGWIAELTGPDIPTN